VSKFKQFGISEHDSDWTKSRTRKSEEKKNYLKPSGYFTNKIKSK